MSGNYVEAVTIYMRLVM